MIAIKRIDARDTVELRHQVMWPDLPKDAVILPEDTDGVHFGAFLGEDHVGVGSFFAQNSDIRLRKLAVTEAMQGRGVASQLLRTAVSYFAKQGFETLWCDARVSAGGFYLRNGFLLSPKVFQKRGVDYVVATRRL